MNSDLEYMTEDGFAQLQAKLKEAQTKLEELQLSRSNIIGSDGDGIHDNAAFELLEIQERGLMRTIADLKDRIARACIIRPPEDTQSVQIGSTVVIKFVDEDETMTIQVLGSVDAQPGAGIISYKSPLGSQLLGKKVGDLVTYVVEKEEKAVKIMDIL